MSILKSALTAMVAIAIAMALALSAWSTEAVVSTAGGSHAAPGPLTAGATTATTATIAGQTLAVKKYKMSTVRKHHSRTNCWTVVGKNVYRLTKFIKRHPGGASRIIALCGKNGTKAFRRQHGTVGKANAVLKKYKIGVLA